MNRKYLFVIRAVAAFVTELTVIVNYDYNVEEAVKVAENREGSLRVYCPLAVVTVQAVFYYAYTTVLTVVICAVQVGEGAIVIPYGKSIVI